jgi:hypothetical protein
MTFFGSTVYDGKNTEQPDFRASIPLKVKEPILLKHAKMELTQNKTGEIEYPSHLFCMICESV